jgi:hypothetical protein
MTELRQRQPRVKRERPPMPPLAVRVLVAERQIDSINRGFYEFCSVDEWPLKHRLKWLLSRIFEDGENVVPHALDHDPALVLRPYNPRIKDVAARYTPHAHDPAHLVYRSKPDHQQKTTGRKPGAERTITTKGSDIWVKTKFARLSRKPKRKAKIASRGFSKQKRSFGGKRK